MAVNLEPRPIFIRRVSAYVVERSAAFAALPDIHRETASEALNAVLQRIDRAVDGRYRTYRDFKELQRKVTDFETEDRNYLFRDETHSDLPRELRRYFQAILPQERRKGAPTIASVTRTTINQAIKLIREGVTDFSRLDTLNRAAQQRASSLERIAGLEFHTNPAGPPSTYHTSLERKVIINDETPPDQKV